MNSEGGILKYGNFNSLNFRKGIKIWLLAAAVFAICCVAGCSSQLAMPYDLNNLLYEYDIVSGSDDSYVIITKHIVSQSDVKIPDTIYDIPVKEISESAFANDVSIKSVTFGKNIKLIGANSFGGCTGLKSIDFSVSASDIQIGEYAFTGCTALEEAVIGENVASVGRGAFYGCESLENVTIPESLSDIGGRAFAETPWLKAKSKGSEFVTVGDGVLVAYNGGKSDVKLPEKVKKISGAFAGNTKLKSVKLTSNVRSIGDMSFMGCKSLETVTVSDGLEDIGKDAFYGCVNLKWLILKDKVSSIGDDAFGYCGAAIYVNEGSEAEKYCTENGIEHCIM